MRRWNAMLAGLSIVFMFAVPNASFAQQQLDSAAAVPSPANPPRIAALTTPILMPYAEAGEVRQIAPPGTMDDDQVDTGRVATQMPRRLQQSEIH